MENKKLYAVIKTSTKTIKSKWFTVENGQVKDVTTDLFLDVVNYNNDVNTFTKIPYSFKDGFITYSFGCGLTHYLQDGNLEEVTTLDVNSISVFTTTDFTMFDIKKSQKDWKQALEIILTVRGEI